MLRRSCRATRACTHASANPPEAARLVEELVLREVRAQLEWGAVAGEGHVLLCRIGGAPHNVGLAGSSRQQGSHLLYEEREVGKPVLLHAVHALQRRRTRRQGAGVTGSGVAAAAGRQLTQQQPRLRRSDSLPTAPPCCRYAARHAPARAAAALGNAQRQVLQVLPCTPMPCLPTNPTGAHNVDE